MRQNEHITIPPYTVLSKQEIKEKQIIEFQFAWQALGLDFSVDLGVLAFNKNGQMLDYLYFDKPSAIDGAITTRLVKKNLSQDFLMHGYDIRKPQSVDKKQIIIDFSKLWESWEKDPVAAVHTIIFSLSIYSNEASLLRVREPHVVLSRLKPKKTDNQQKSDTKKSAEMEMDQKRLFQLDFTEPISDKKSLIWFKITHYQNGYELTALNQPCGGQNILQLLPFLRSPELVPVTGLDSCPDINSDIGRELSSRVNYSNQKPLRLRLRFGMEKFLPPFGKMDTKVDAKNSPPFSIAAQFFSFDEVGYYIDSLNRG